ncbi:MAG: hypothetical protein L7S44_03905 [Flavobacteriaceae bacterium]|nr:hypothetical protein [Flavobacteriaceae bacterium]
MANYKVKGWKHYFWEFFMVFLAITVGFFVENFQKKKAKDRAEVEFVKSFKNDLINDISELDQLIERRKEREIRIDSMITIIDSDLLDMYNSEMYFYTRYLPRPSIFRASLSTISQLKNSGNFTLIKNQKVVDTLLAYEHSFKFIDRIRDREEYLVKRVFDQINILFDPMVFNQMNLYDIEFVRPKGSPSYKSKDKDALSTFLSNLHYIKTVNVAQIGWFTRFQNQAKKTLIFVESQYDLD